MDDVLPDSLGALADVDLPVQKNIDLVELYEDEIEEEKYQISEENKMRKKNAEELPYPGEEYDNVEEEKLDQSMDKDLNM